MPASLAVAHMTDAQLLRRLRDNLITVEVYQEAAWRFEAQKAAVKESLAIVKELDRRSLQLKLL